MTYLHLALSFLKIGLISIGGGYVMIPLIQKEVALFGIQAREFVNVVAIAQMTPGPIGLNTATYTGYRAAGFPGSLVSTAFCMVPSFIVALFIFRAVYINRSRPEVESFIRNLRPVILGLITSSVIVMAKDISLISDYKGLLIFVLVFLGAYKLKLHPAALLLLAAVSGAIIH